MRGLIVGDRLADGDALSALTACVTAGALTAARIDRQADGDIRYWDVHTSQSPVLERLEAFGRARFAEVAGREPSAALMMVNHIAAGRSPNGSGGGWHRDSFSKQYKAFAYLTEVSEPAHGAFAYLPSSNSMLWRAAALGHRLTTGADRYDEKTISRLLRLGFAAQPVIVPPAVPFFVDTSLVHRGLPITKGERIMATLYLFESTPDWVRELRPQP